MYLPDFEFCFKLRPYLRTFRDAKVLSIPKTEEDAVLKKLIPDLNLLAGELTLSKAIQDKIVMDDCNFLFYFDKKGKEIILKLNVRYGKHEFNIFKDCSDKVVYRDSKRRMRL